MPVFDYQGEKNTQLIKDALTLKVSILVQPRMLIIPIQKKMAGKY